MFPPEVSSLPGRARWRFDVRLPRLVDTAPFPGDAPDHRCRPRRKARRRPGHRPRARRRPAGRRFPPRQRLRGHLGDRPSGRPGAAARDQPRVETLAARPPADPPRRVAAGRLRGDQGAVRGRPPGDQRPGGRARDLRHGCRPRRGADLPLHLRGRRLPQAVPAPVDLLAHRGRHPPGVRPAARRPRPRSAGRRRPRPQPRRLAGRHEPLAGLLAGLQRGAALRRAGPDPDARHGGRARAGDPRLRARGLPGGRGHLLARGGGISGI
jgi:hypothetical protein